MIILKCSEHILFIGSRDTELCHPLPVLSESASYNLPVAFSHQAAHHAEVSSNAEKPAVLEEVGMRCKEMERNGRHLPFHDFSANSTRFLKSGRPVRNRILFCIFCLHFHIFSNACTVVWLRYAVGACLKRARYARGAASWMVCAAAERRRQSQRARPLWSLARNAHVLKEP